MPVQLSANARRVLESRYLRKDKEGRLAEDADGLFRRVAHAVAAAERRWGNEAACREWEELFYEMMSQLLFLPNSPTLMNAGTALHQLSACFVLPVEDSMDGIFSSLKQAALIQQSGGGTGFNFSRLRPQHDLITKTGGSASGPVSFMKIFDAATEHVKQGGKRRGANMGILNVDHPDIEAFISAKQQSSVLTNFNISVGISNAFMQAVLKKESWNLLHPNSHVIVKTISAEKLWTEIVESAWDCGDPGLLFLDTINAANPTPELGMIQATNPCGEVPLLPFESCNLGSVNLSKFVKQLDGTTGIDWQELESVVRLAVRFLDDVIDANQYIIPETKAIVQGNRKIGLGVMGWADMLCQLGISYDTEEAVALADKLMSFIQSGAMAASAQLARERGPFPNWAKSRYYPERPLRNASLTSIAPTGSISIIADASSSIEPFFALAFERRHVLNDEKLPVINRCFADYLVQTGQYNEQVLAHLQAGGSAARLPGLSPEVKALFKTAYEIAPEWHVLQQAAYQRHVDNAVSKTINLPETATPADIDRIYKMAWQQQLKGITIYRQNSRPQQILHPGIHTAAEACKVCLS
jgi:ribonucleoside-diphosphate reductase alpha chain